MPLPFLAGLGTAAASPLGKAAIGAAIPTVLGSAGGIARGIGRGAQHLGGGAYNFLHGLGQQYLPQGVQNFLGGAANQVGGLYNAVAGNRPEDQAPMGPEQQLANFYLQQIGQPINIPYAQQQQQMINQFNQQTIPGLQERFTGAGGQRSSAFGQQLGQAGADLNVNLEALRERSQFGAEQIMSNRLGNISQYLGGQQNLGLRAQELNQLGTIANREAAIKGLGAMGNYDVGRQAEDTRRQDVQARVIGGLGNQALNKQFDTKHNPAVAAGVQQFGVAALPAILRAMGL